MFLGIWWDCFNTDTFTFLCLFYKVRQNTARKTSLTQLSRWPLYRRTYMIGIYFHLMLLTIRTYISIFHFLSSSKSVIVSLSGGRHLGDGHYPLCLRVWQASLPRRQHCCALRQDPDGAALLPSCPVCLGRPQGSDLSDAGEESCT